jgi:hypothetical protein
LIAHAASHEIVLNRANFLLFRPVCKRMARLTRMQDWPQRSGVVPVHRAKRVRHSQTGREIYICVDTTQR